MGAKTKATIHSFRPDPDVERAVKSEVRRRTGGKPNRGIQTKVINEGLRASLCK
jgi:hypothetical protein